MTQKVHTFTRPRGTSRRRVSLTANARERIDNEGLIVQDSKGNPIPHPALEIERRAQAEIRAWQNTMKGRQ